MKTLQSLLLLFACSLPFCPPAHAQQNRQAAAYAVAEVFSGRILDGANGDKKLQVASLTKIATAMVVLDWAESSERDLSTLAVVPDSVTTIGGHNPVGFQPGDRVTLRNLLYASLLQSDNVAAQTLADHVGRSLLTRATAEVKPVDLFVAQMNALARKLGMNKTQFLNPHGIDSREKPYSTANDMALLASYAMKRPSFRFYVSQRSREITRNLQDGSTVHYNLVNTNALLGQHDIDGVKTGKTSRAGDCLIISSGRAPLSVKNDDGSHTITPRRLVVVVLGAADRFSLAERLLQKSWSQFDSSASNSNPSAQTQWR
jgi:D-alanyl-D-alanine carboxypeptidase (penicillin-binding protein 5/6)